MQKEMRNKRKTKTAVWRAVRAVVVGMLVVSLALFYPTSRWERILFISFAAILAVGAIWYALHTVRTVGYYRCPNCGNMFVPSPFHFLFGMRLGKDKNLRCPQCGQMCRCQKVFSLAEGEQINYLRK